jgi:hypothetical protein
MNKELIKKYKAEFDHWLNGGSLLLGQEKPDNTFEWVLPTVIPWNNISCTYIINDKYVEFRKALAEGKTVQFFNTEDRLYNSSKELNTWHNTDTIHTHGKPSDYRIKPEEPKFGIGDWVRVNLFESSVGTYKDNNIRQITENPEIIEEVPCYEVGFAIKVPLRYIEPWQPKPDEWCVMKEEVGTDSFSVQKWHKDAKWVPEPFIGTLPTFIEEA